MIAKNTRKSKPLSVAEAWWLFFPFKGLEVTNKTPDLHAPLFGDFSIINKEHMNKIVPQLKLNQRMVPGHDHESDILFIVKRATFGEDFHSFISVRRTGKIEPRKNLESLMSAAEKRAHEVSALLGLCFLCDNKRTETCGLVEFLHRRNKSTAMFDLKYGEFAFTTGGGFSHMILDSRRNIRKSRTDIKKTLAQKRFQGLSSIILGSSSTVGKSIHHTVTQSLLTLSEALHAASPATQLLGAVTSIEILLSDIGNPYEIIHRRLASLAGDITVDNYDAEDVFKARHRFVHKGEKLDDEILSIKAIALGLSCLLNFANAAQSFNSKVELVQYLDFIFVSKKMQPNWNNKQLKQFASFAIHKPGNYRFAFI